MRTAIGLAVAAVVLTGVALVAARMAAVERHLADTREALATLDYPQAAGSVEAALRQCSLRILNETYRHFGLGVVDFLADGWRWLRPGQGACRWRGYLRCGTGHLGGWRCCAGERWRCRPRCR